mgnify:CR=1 FL=1
MAASLRFRTLFAGTAIAALALTGCAGGGGGGGGDDSSGGEESAAPEAPTDYTTEQVESTLAASTVDGEELSTVTPAADAVGEDMSQEGISMMEGILEEAEIDPAECQDPLLGQLTGGMLEDVMEDSVMGTTADGVSITGLGGSTVTPIDDDAALRAAVLDVSRPAKLAA